MIRTSFARAMLLSLLVCTGACASTAPPAAAPEPARVDTKGEGPRLPSWLGITPSQKPEVLELSGRVVEVIAPVEDATESLARSLASGLRRCRNDTEMIRMRADSLVREGERVRGPILDALDDFHAILTPKQRKALVAYILDEDRESSRESREERAEGGLSDLDLGLSWSQMATMLLRIRVLQNEYEERAEPWVARYRAAVRAFGKDDFSAHDQALAEVPAVELAADFVVDAFRQLLPLLEEEQCKRLAELVDTRLDERAREKARRR